jgi:hypothetical protein
MNVRPFFSSAFAGANAVLRRVWPLTPALLVLGFIACTSDKAAQPAEQAEDLSHPDYRAIADELITELPTIITDNDFKGVVDSTTLYQLSPIVTRLNDSLGRLAVLHQIYDTASSEQLRNRVNLVAIPFRIIADRAKTMVQAELPANRQYWFHTFLEQRTSAAGLPHTCGASSRGPLPMCAACVLTPLPHRTGHRAIPPASSCEDHLVCKRVLRCSSHK